MAEIVDFGLQQHKIKMDSRYFENVLSVVAGDTGRRIEVQLLDTNGMVQDTTGLNLRLNAVIAGKATYTDATLVDAATGKYQLDLSNGMFLAPGNWQFQWQITDSAGKKLHSFAFTGNVGINISEGGSQATNFYLNLEDLKAMQDDLVNGTFNSEALETNIARKLEALEQTYAPRLTEVTAQLAQMDWEKAGYEYVDQSISTISGGAIKGKYPTLSALKQFYPEGAVGPFQVEEDGNRYIWDINKLDWVSIGPYEPAEIGDETITSKKIVDVELKKIDTRFSFFENYLNETTWDVATGIDSIKLTSKSAISISNTGAILQLDYSKGVDFEFDVESDYNFKIGVALLKNSGYTLEHILAFQNRKAGAYRFDFKLTLNEVLIAFANYPAATSLGVYIWNDGAVATGKSIRLYNLKSRLLGKSKATDGFDLINEVIGQTDLSNIPKVVGQVPYFDKATKKTITGLHLCTPDISITGSGKVVDELFVYNGKTSQASVDFIVGVIDQNKLVIENKKYTYIVPAGYSKIKPTETIEIPNGQYLFMDLSTTGFLYTGFSQLNVNLIQDVDHVLTGAYNGMIMYSTADLIPFAYSIRNMTENEKINSVNNSVSAAMSQLSLIDSQIDDLSNVYTSPAGLKYEMSVNDDGSPIFIKHYPEKIFVLGNSISKGFETFGMAASSVDKDWANIVKKEIETKTTGVTMTRIQGNPWEGAVTSADRLAWLQANCQIDTDTDLILIQLGDNINTDAKKATFPEDAKALIKFFRTRCPKAKLLWINGWFGYEFTFDHVKNACEAMGAKVVDIREYTTDAKYASAIGNTYTLEDGSEHEITDWGVAAHPGDLGMAGMAKNVLDVLNLK